MPVDSDADILGMFSADDFGVAATWAPGWTRDWPRTLVADLVAGTITLTTETTDLVVIQDDPTDRAASFGGTGTIARRDSIMLPAAALPASPMNADPVTVDGGAFAIGHAESDIDRRLWRAALVKA